MRSVPRQDGNGGSPVARHDGDVAGPVGGQDGGQLAGVLEAAKALGLTPDGVRARIRRGTLAARKGNDGQWRVELSRSVLARQDDHQDSGQDEGYAPAGRAAEPAQPDVAGLLENLATLKSELADERVARARAEGELAVKDALVAELREALTREATVLCAALAKAEARADRLEAALAEARRPWLAKVIEGLRRKG
jgi:hypothetical protein